MRVTSKCPMSPTSTTRAFASAKKCDVPRLEGLTSLFDGASTAAESGVVRGMIRPRGRSSFERIYGDDAFDPLSGVHSPSVEARAARNKARRGLQRSDSPCQAAHRSKLTSRNPNVPALGVEEIVSERNKRGASPTRAARYERNRRRAEAVRQRADIATFF